MAPRTEAAQRGDFYGCIKILVPAAECAVALGECSIRMHLSSHELVDAGSCMNSRCRLEKLQIQGPKTPSPIDEVQPHI